MLATAQRFEELHPEVAVSWGTRSLQSFADQCVEDLARGYDLLVIDHPSCGHAARSGVLAPLDDLLPAEFLRDQERNSVGQSYTSYLWNGHLWALPIDAAAPVSLYRPDLLHRFSVTLPRTWEELMDLARRGFVAVPGLAIDGLMHFFMLCIALGEEPFAADDGVVTPEAGARALQLLRELLQACPPDCLEANPIAVWNRLSSADDAVYCPFAYGYSNYSRRGYGTYVVEAGELVSFGGRPLRSVLGGAGLAISSRCRDLPAAAAYAKWVADPECQRTLYFDSGGQPGHRAAWLDPEVNRRSHGFFEKTLPALDRAWLRPRFDGFIEFQDRAGRLLHSWLRQGGAEEEVVGEMNRLLHAARQPRGVTAS